MEESITRREREKHCTEYSRGEERRREREKRTEKGGEQRRGEVRG